MCLKEETMYICKMFWSTFRRHHQDRSHSTPILISEDWKLSLTWAACLCWGCGGSYRRKPCNPERWEPHGSILQERSRVCQQLTDRCKHIQTSGLNCSCPLQANSEPFISGVRQSWTERPISQNPLKGFRQFRPRVHRNVTSTPLNFTNMLLQQTV